METQSEAAVQLIVSKLDGSQIEVNAELSSTVQSLKETLEIQGIVEGLFAYTLMMDDGTLLRDGSAQLAEYGLEDCSNIVIIKGRTRNYSKISQFDKVLENMQYPQGLLSDDQGKLLVCNYYGILKVYDANFELSQETCLPRRQPTQMVFAPTGELLIAFNNAQIGVFDPIDFRLLRWIGHIRESNGIAMFEDKVFVSDFSLHLVCLYNFTTGDLMSSWVGFSCPCGLAVVEDRLLAVADRNHDKVQLRDFDGNHVVDIGAGGQLRRPNDVAVDHDGYLLVIDTENKRIAVFDQDGSLLAAVMPGCFEPRANTFSYISVNHVTGTISVSLDDEHKVGILAPLCPAVIAH